MNVAQTPAATALAALNALYNAATLTFYQGAIPPSPETPIGTQNVLAQFQFGNPAFAAPIYTNLQELTTATFASRNVTPTAGGTACFARAIAGATALSDYTVGASWQPNLAVMAGQYAVNGGSTYLCVARGTTAASGGPTGVGTAIQDGTAVWSFNNSGNPDIVMASTAVLASVPLSITSLTHALPAV